MSLVLGTRDLVVDFPGTRAVDHVTMEIHEREVVGLVGANGSGKTTLVSALCGALQPTAGSLFDLNGSLRFASPRHAVRRRGIALAPQEPQLAGTLSCWENLMLGEEKWHGLAFRRRQRRGAVSVLSDVLPAVDPNAPAETLQKPDRAILALTAARRRARRLLALDEPTAVLGERSMEIVEAAVAEVVSRDGAVVLVSHRMRDIVRLATRVVVLVDGAVTYDGEIGSADDLLAKLVQGRSPRNRGESEPPRDHGSEAGNAAENILIIRKLKTRDGADFGELTVKRGEIVGLAGLAGSGRSRLLRVLSGAESYDGEISFMGRRLPHGVRNVRRTGADYIPEDRAAHAIFSPLTVGRNLTVNRLVGLRSLLRRASARRERELARELVDRFSIRTSGIRAPIVSLSGGNQQRVVLARVLEKTPALLLADEPTQGVDAAGRVAVHSLLRSYANSGGAILVSISDFEELLSLATRLVVLRDGQLVAKFPVNKVDYQTILRTASGVSDDAAEVTDAC